MKTRLLAMATSVAITSASSSAIANSADEVYFGLQAAYGLYSEENLPDFDLGAAIGRFGAFGTNNLAIEGRFGMGVQDDTQSVNGTDVTLELDTLAGAYGVGHLTFGRYSSVYGVLGFTRVKGEASVPGQSLAGGDADISYGVGLDLGITKSITLNIEYMSYISGSSFDLNAGALGLTIGF